jgi:hypothetical protein
MGKGGISDSKRAAEETALNLDQAWCLNSEMGSAVSMEHTGDNWWVSTLPPLVVDCDEQRDLMGYGRGALENRLMAVTGESSVVFGWSGKNGENGQDFGCSVVPSEKALETGPEMLGNRSLGILVNGGGGPAEQASPVIDSGLDRFRHEGPNDSTNAELGTIEAPAVGGNDDPFDALKSLQVAQPSGR